jgi:hypothetical protein
MVEAMVGDHTSAKAIVNVVFFAQKIYTTSLQIAAFESYVWQRAHGFWV